MENMEKHGEAIHHAKFTIRKEGIGCATLAQFSIKNIHPGCLITT
jgi:hypothetical protein